MSTFSEGVISELLSLCCSDRIIDQRDRLCGDGRDFRGKGRRGRVAINDVGRAERFEEVGVFQRCSSYNWRKTGEFGELDG